MFFDLAGQDLLALRVSECGQLALDQDRKALGKFECPGYYFVGHMSSRQK